MNGGWIKTYRKLMEWEWYTDSHMVHLFIHLILKANHEDKRHRGKIIKRGQLVTSRNILSIETGISEQTIRTCLERLKLTNELTIQSTNRNSVITICNYDSYQEKKEETNQPTNQPTNQQVTNHQTRSKEVKNNSTIGQQEKIDFEEFKNLFNSTCFSLPKIKAITDKRKAKIKARYKQIGGDLGGAKIFFERIEQSNFLTNRNGENRNGWTASFDWIFNNEENVAKIIEGNYDNRENNKQKIDVKKLGSEMISTKTFEEF